METIRELGPCLIRWNGEAVVADNVILILKTVTKWDGKNLVTKGSFISICLKYRRRVKIKKIPFYLSFIKELNDPKPAQIIMKSLLESVGKKKLSTMIVDPVQPTHRKRKKEFHFGGFAHWRLI